MLALGNLKQEGCCEFQPGLQSETLFQKQNKNTRRKEEGGKEGRQADLGDG